MPEFLIIALATWYVAYAVTSTHGPGGVFDWIREHVWHGRRGYAVGTVMAGNTEVEITPREPLHNGLLDCPVCLAFWAGLALLLLPMGVVTQALAVAGAAMLAHSWSGWRFVQ